ncbi:hypothetical protein Tco_1464525, partial [Tanacetum coccineum]
MVACLEMTDGNSDFHEIMDFLASSLIHHALIINATVDSKAIVVTEASIRSSLLFNDVDGTACLTNESIFQNLALMGYEAEGEGSGEPTEPQPTPSPTHPSIGDQPLETASSPSHATTQDSRDSLEGTNRNEWNQGKTNSKPESGVDYSTVFDDQDADHDKSSGDKGGNSEELVSTARPKVSTARPDIDAARQEYSAVEPRTPPTTTCIFDDEDITMAQTLIKMKEEK